MVSQIVAQHQLSVVVQINNMAVDIHELSLGRDDVEDQILSEADFSTLYIIPLPAFKDMPDLGE